MVEADPEGGAGHARAGLREEARSEEEHEIASRLTPSALTAAAVDERRAVVRYPFSSDSRWLACVSDVKWFIPTTRPPSDQTPMFGDHLHGVRRKQPAHGKLSRQA